MQTSMDIVLHQKFLISILVIVAGSIIFANITDENLAGSIGDFSYIIITATLLVVSILVVSRYGKVGKYGKAWVFFAASSASWFIAEMLWLTYDKVLEVDPYPSLADVFYIAAYPLFFVFAVLYLMSIKKAISKKTTGIATGIGVLLLIPTLLFTIQSMDFEKDNIVEFALAFSYPVADSIVIIPSIIGVMLFLKGEVNFMWTLILIGFISLSVADTLFLIEQTFGTYKIGSPTDIFFLWAYVLLAFGAYHHWKIFSPNDG